MSKVELDLVLIEEGGYHFHLTARINGVEANLLLDTGASRTVLDKERVQRFGREIIPTSLAEKRSTGLGTNQMEIYSGSIASFVIGEKNVPGEEVAMLDLSHVNESYRMLGLKEIDGVVGNDFLVEHNAIINFSEKSLLLG